jgi:alkaline phosphatase
MRALVEALEQQFGLVFTAEERPEIEQSISQALDAGNPTEGLRQTVKLAAVRRDARIGISFTSGGHTDTKVQLHAQGPGAERFREPLENSDLPRLIQAAVGR